MVCRDGGLPPIVIWSDGTREWWVNYSDETKEWWVNFIGDRDNDLLAYIHLDGTTPTPMGWHQHRDEYEPILINEIEFIY